MSCTPWRKMISDLHDQALPPEENERLQHHLAECPACREVYQWQQSLSTMLASVSQPHAPAGFNQAVWRRIEAKPQAIRVWRWVPLTAGVGLAAAALVLITFQSLHYSDEPRPGLLSHALHPVESHSVESPRHDGVAARKPKSEPVPPNEISVLTPIPLSVQLDIEPHLEPPSSVQTAHQDVMPLPQTPLEEIQRMTQMPQKPARPQTPETAHQASTGFQTAHTSAATSSATTLSAAVQAQEASFTIRLLKNKIQLNRDERARLEFRLISAEHVSVKVCSREGKWVKTVLDEHLAAGDHSVEWDGVSDSGNKVASGIYLLVFQTPTTEKHFKLAIIK